MKQKSLKDILNGQSNPDTERKVKKRSIEDDGESSFDIDKELDDTTNIESIELTPTQSSPLIKPSQFQSIQSNFDASKNAVSAKSFLIGNSKILKTLNKKKIDKQKKNTKSETIIISLDNEDDSDIEMTEKEKLKKLNEVNNRFKQLTNSKTDINPMSNYRKTNLKDLFGKVQKGSKKISTVSNTLQRKNQISKLKELEVTWPEKQLYEPMDDFIALRSEESNKLTLPLTKKVDNPLKSITTSPEDFKLLNQKNTFSKEESSTNTVQISCTPLKSLPFYKENHSLLIDHFSPTELKHILLEPKLKTLVYDWILSAFEKLKKATTRNQLIQKKNNSKEEDLDDFSNFIVYDEDMNSVDDYDTSVTGISNGTEEFVPLMILYGCAVGKNTLVKVIMDSLDGQIYEINTSNNRSKKNILESLSEFSTTHYVKEKYSKGLIVLDDVDVLFKEHDKFFWYAVERLLQTARKPVVMICKDINYLPSNLLQIAINQNSFFEAKRISPKSVESFLQYYMKKIGCEVNAEALNSIVEVNNKDIRKSLLNLQFLLLSPGTFKLPMKIDTNQKIVNSLSEYSKKMNILSHADILDSIVEFKSLIKDETDSTLRTPEAIQNFKDSTDEQLKLQNDYLIDYKIHLNDEIRKKQLPHELNISKYLKKALRNLDNFESTENLKIKYIQEKNFRKITDSNILFLSSRIAKKNSPKVSARKTRNSSKKLYEILENFNTTEVTDEIIEYDFALNNKSNLIKYINPFIYKIAQSEHKAKAINRSIYQVAVQNSAEDLHPQVLRMLVEKHLLKSFWFNSDPASVTKHWENT